MGEGFFPLPFFFIMQYGVFRFNAASILINSLFRD